MFKFALIPLSVFFFYNSYAAVENKCDEFNVKITNNTDEVVNVWSDYKKASVLINPGETGITTGKATYNPLDTQFKIRKQYTHDELWIGKINKRFCFQTQEFDGQFLGITQDSGKGKLIPSGTPATNCGRVCNKSICWMRCNPDAPDEISYILQMK